MNQITTQYITENGACYEQYVITDPAAKTSLTITPERGGTHRRQILNFIDDSFSITDILISDDIIEFIQ